MILNNFLRGGYKIPISIQMPGDYVYSLNKRRLIPKESVPRKRICSKESESDSNSESDEEIKSSLLDVLLPKQNHYGGKRNHIYFDKYTTKDNCANLISQIESTTTKILKLNCNYDMESLPNIYLHINSPGGSVFPCFSVIDTIRKSKVPIVTVVDGMAASSATLISVFGKERWISKHAYMLIHQISGGCWGTMENFMDEFENMREITNRIIEIYTSQTKMKAPELRKLLKHDRYWRAEECLKNGIVDKII